MNKNSWQKPKYLGNRKSFEDEMKSFFILFKGLSMKEIKEIFWKVRVELSEVKATFKINIRN